MFAANTPLDVRKPSTEIVTSGVFRKSRNPIYLGMLLLCAGVAFLANSLWILVLVLPLAIILQKGVIEKLRRLQQIAGCRVQIAKSFKAQGPPLP
jgi:protein-S-isoprenylcysteine O-methyltransferase Ste14